MLKSWLAKKGHSRGHGELPTWEFCQKSWTLWYTRTNKWEQGTCSNWPITVLEANSLFLAKVRVVTNITAGHCTVTIDQCSCDQEMDCNGMDKIQDFPLPKKYTKRGTFTMISLNFKLDCSTLTNLLNFQYSISASSTKYMYYQLF